MSTPPPTSHLTIAGLTFRLNWASSTPPHLLQAFSRHYEPYLAPADSTPQMELEVAFHRPPPEQPEVSYSIQPTFRGTAIHLDEIGYQGVFHPDKRHGSLTLSAAQPLKGLDYFLRVAFTVALFDTGGLLLHSAGVVQAGGAILFFGPSGAGKTTITRLSGDRVVLSDDLVALKPNEEGQGWLAHSTPFWNPDPRRSTVSSPQSVPLQMLLRLVQSTSAHLAPLPPAQAVAELMGSTPLLPTDPQRAPAVIERCRQLAETVPVSSLHFRLNDSFWELLSPTAIA